MIVYLHEGLDHLKGASVAQERISSAHQKTKSKILNGVTSQLESNQEMQLAGGGIFAHDHTKVKAKYTI